MDAWNYLQRCCRKLGRCLVAAMALLSKWSSPGLGTGPSGHVDRHGPSRQTDSYSTKDRLRPQQDFVTTGRLRTTCCEAALAPPAARTAAAADRRARHSAPWTLWPAFAIVPARPHPR